MIINEISIILINHIDLTNEIIHFKNNNTPNKISIPHSMETKTLGTKMVPRIITHNVIDLIILIDIIQLLVIKNMR